jgi:hypothetical protein
MHEHTYRLAENNDLLVIGENGRICDRISAPVNGNRDGDTDEYVRISEHPEYFPEDMRWSVTTGTRVRQTYGLREGRTGTIVGQARSRKADRIFAENIARAVSGGRELSADDFEILIDSEGALIEFDDDPGAVHWYPGQSFGFARIS